MKNGKWIALIVACILVIGIIVFRKAKTARIIEKTNDFVDLKIGFQSGYTRIERGLSLMTKLGSISYKTDGTVTSNDYIIKRF